MAASHLFQAKRLLWRISWSKFSVSYHHLYRRSPFNWLQISRFWLNCSGFSSSQRVGDYKPRISGAAKEEKYAHFQFFQRSQQSQRGPPGRHLQGSAIIPAHRRTAIPAKTIILHWQILSELSAERKRSASWSGHRTIVRFSALRRCSVRRARRTIHKDKKCMQFWDHVYFAERGHRSE